MKIYCMSDIHGCYSALCDALEFVFDHLDEPDTKLIFLGDYIHGGEDNIAVLKKIMGLQNIYGHRKVVALLGNHEENLGTLVLYWVLRRHTIVYQASLS